MNVVEEARCGSFRFAWCAWCHSHASGEHDTQAAHNEAFWLVEVCSPDAEIVQRLGACDDHADELFNSMGDEPPQSLNGNYSVVRRWLPSDVVLRLDVLELPGLA